MTTAKKNNSNKKEVVKRKEVVFKRDNGLQFTKVKIEQILKNKAYSANFKYTYGEGNMFMEASVGGISEANCIEKTEKFLETKLNKEEFVITKNEKPKTEKQKIEAVLKENKIVSKVKINKNEIHIKYEKDWSKVRKLFPDMATVYGFLN